MLSHMTKFCGGFYGIFECNFSLSWCTFSRRPFFWNSMLVSLKDRRRAIKINIYQVNDVHALHRNLNTTLCVYLTNGLTALSMKRAANTDHLTICQPSRRLVYLLSQIRLKLKQQTVSARAQISIANTTVPSGS